MLSPEWTAHHTAVVEGFMSAVVSLRVAGGSPIFNAGTGQTSVTPHTPFATNVFARVYALTGGDVTPSNVVEEQVRVLGYRISIPLATTPSSLDEDILVDILNCEDPMLAGKTLNVTDIIRGSHLLERDLICDLKS